MEETKSIYAQAINKFGYEKQVDMLIEEMSELTQALLKFRRKPDSIDVIANLHEEFADVEIVMAQIKGTLNENMLNQYRLLKTRKLIKLLAND